MNSARVTPGDLRPAHNADGYGHAGQRGAEQGHHNHRKQKGRQHLKEFRGPHEQFVPDALPVSGQRPDGNADAQRHQRGEAAHRHGGLAPGDDAREDVAAQVIAAADQAVFTGRAHGRSDHLEGIHRVDQRAHASEQQDGPEQNQPKHGGPVLQVHLPRFTQGDFSLYSQAALCSDMATSSPLSFWDQETGRRSRSGRWR